MQDHQPTRENIRSVIPEKLKAQFCSQAQITNYEKVVVLTLIKAGCLTQGKQRVDRKSKPQWEIVNLTPRPRRKMNGCRVRRFVGFAIYPYFSHFSRSTL